MRKIGGLLAVLGGVAVGLLLSGCVAPPEITPVVPPPTPAAVAGAAAPEAAPAVAVAERFPLPPPEPEIRVVNSDNCIACHTNQEKVQELAVEPEKKESLSEGEG